VFAALGEAGIRVRSMRNTANRLEELFVRMTAPAGGPEGASPANAEAAAAAKPAAQETRA
jgi:ABC-2 type transport system ATP-binding protein